MFLYEPYPAGQKLNKLYVVKLPDPIDRGGLKTLVISLLKRMAGFEIFHQNGLIMKVK